MPRVVRRSLAAALATAGLLLGSAATAQADVKLTGASAKPITAASRCTAEPKDAIYSNTAFDPALGTDYFNSQNLASLDDLVADPRAGATTDFCVGYTLTPDFNMLTRQRSPIPPPEERDPRTDKAHGDDQRNVSVDLPAGYAADLRSAAVCTEDQFGPDALPYGWWDWDWETHVWEIPEGSDLATCPPASQVGEAGVRVSTSVLDVHTNIQNRVIADDCTVRCTTTPQTQIYNLEAGPNELGRLGVQIMPPTGADLPSKFIVRLILAPDGSGRVRAVVNDAPRGNVYGGPMDLYIETVVMRMWGSKAEHPTMAADFSENSTRCSTGHAIDVDVETYGDSTYPDDPKWGPVFSNASSAPFTLAGCDALPFVPTVDVNAAEQTPSTPTAVT